MCHVQGKTSGSGSHEQTVHYGLARLLRMSGESQVQLMSVTVRLAHLAADKNNDAHGS